MQLIEKKNYISKQWGKLATFSKILQIGCLWSTSMGELHPAMQTYTARGDFTTTLCLAYVYPEKPFKTYVLVQPQDVGYRLSEIYGLYYAKGQERLL